ncbi:hypothetical protein RYA05_03720 [Pseudomonas syringae pv. actinidiae]|nr:hypothetical protein [Pseudomonas syringae pv. actinidiae]
MKISNTFKQLKAMAQLGNQVLSFAQPLHPKPEFFKFTWWIFHEGSPCEGEKFRTDEYAMPTAQAMALHDELCAKQIPHIIYNRSEPRLPKGGCPPWDVSADRWKKAKWAPNFADDTDREWHGHK